MKRTIADNAAATVAYADVFDYVVTEREAVYWSVGGFTSFPRRVSGIERVRWGSRIYVCMRGRKRLIAERMKRKRIARDKWERIEQIAKRFRVIPTLLLVGVTGGLSMDNAKREDDIDLFFITRKNTLWISRIMAALFAEALGVRRRPDDVHVRDKVCLNMFMAEDDLTLPSAEQDLFAAHEVLQMKPLWQRGSIYRAFITANTWTAIYLPNATKDVSFRSRLMETLPDAGKYAMGLALLEPVARLLQIWYMSRRRTREVIRRGQIRFHPNDARRWVSESLKKRLKRWHIPLDSIFYHR